MTWLPYILGLLSGILLTLVLQAVFVSWLFGPIEKTARVSKSWWRG